MRFEEAPHYARLVASDECACYVVINAEDCEPDGGWRPCPPSLCERPDHSEVVPCERGRAHSERDWLIAAGEELAAAARSLDVRSSERVRRALVRWDELMDRNYRDGYQAVRR